MYTICARYLNFTYFIYRDCIQRRLKLGIINLKKKFVFNYF